MDDPIHRRTGPQWRIRDLWKQWLEDYQVVSTFHTHFLPLKIHFLRYLVTIATTTPKFYIFHYQSLEKYLVDHKSPNICGERRIIT